MQTITWSYPCYYCHRPITRGKPTLLFSIDELEKSLLIGVSHSTCCAGKLKYGHFQMCPPNRLFNDQVSFLTHFFSMLYILPGAENPNRELRWSLARLLDNYPLSVKKPMQVLQRFIKDHNRWGFKWLYEGDLEIDFLKALGQAQRMVKDKPVAVEVDFRKVHPSK
jgi:hypothetical protein